MLKNLVGVLVQVVHVQLLVQVHTGHLDPILLSIYYVNSLQLLSSLLGLLLYRRFSLLFDFLLNPGIYR